MELLAPASGIAHSNFDTPKMFLCIVAITSVLKTFKCATLFASDADAIYFCTVREMPLQC
jgi:hypothetical protein